MRTTRALSAALLCCSVLAGCISPQSFVDPSAPRISYEDLPKRAEPLKLKLSVEFQRNGEPFPRADSTLRDNTERVLRATGLIIPTDEGAGGEIRVVLNNVGDRGAAAAKGFGTGLTFGLVGTTVMDAYEMKVTITANGKTASRTDIKHALYTAIGNTTLPPGIEPVPPIVAFGRVLEQMLLRALQDMQKAGELTYLRFPKSLAWRDAGPH
jgi:hypothetical protein